ncbi:MAG: hypothetical protein LBN95_12865 [Prevotellaceae bacterium]|jgi:hypothetical protein|nr:hypothetical protein [Prevotellaceae bacterium]
MLPFQGANGGWNLLPNALHWALNYPTQRIGLKSIWLSAKRLYRHCKFALLPERQIYFSPMATPWGEFSPIAKRSGALGVKWNGIKSYVALSGRKWLVLSITQCVALG